MFIETNLITSDSVDLRLGGVCDSCVSRRTSTRTLRVRVAPETFVLQTSVSSPSKHLFWEMSQSNRQLSRSNILSVGEKINSDDVASASSMALKAEESRVYLTKTYPGNGVGRLKEPNNADANLLGCGHVDPLASDMETHCCQTAAAPREELLNAVCRVGDARSFSACATISETARELCKAVSVSLGLAMESNETSDLDASLPPCNDQMRGEYLYMPLNCPGAHGAVTEYKCPDRDDQTAHGQKQLVEIFKSAETAARLQHLAPTRISVNEFNFALCEADDLTLDEGDHLDTAARAALYPYAPSAPGRLAHYDHNAAERQCRVYKPHDEATDFVEAPENRFSGYQPEQYGVRVKCEDGESAGALWGSNYTSNERYNSQGLGSRPCMDAHSTGSNPAFICNPYERSVMRPEQWYPGGMLRPPYPNSNYVKTEVGEWLDVAYNDTRYVIIIIIIIVSCGKLSWNYVYEVVTGECALTSLKVFQINIPCGSY